MRIQRLAWAGIKLELEDVTLLVDAWRNVSFFGGAWRGEVPPIRVETTRRYALLTHLHTDHFDPETLEELIGGRRSGAAVVCHEPQADEVAAHALPLRSQRLYEPRSYGPFTVTPVPAVDGWNADQVSWVITGAGKRIIHCGDTLWHGAWWDIARAYGPFDLAFLPINGVLAPGRQPVSDVPATLTPEQAVAAGVVLGAAAVVPIHYGVTNPGVYEEYPDAEGTFLKTAKARGQRILLMEAEAFVEPSAF